MATKKAGTSKRAASSGKNSTNRARRPAGNDAIALLKEDHKKVRQLLEKLESASVRASRFRDSLLTQIEDEVKIHTRIEEDIFYPAFKEAVRKKQDQHLYYEAVEEHHVVDMVLEEFEGLNGADQEQFAAKSKVLKDLIEHHATEEEQEMFPMARKVMGAQQLRELGERLKERKQELTEEMATAG